MRRMVSSRQALAVAVGTAALAVGLTGFSAGQTVVGIVGVSLFGAAVLVLVGHGHQRAGTTMSTVQRLERAVARLESRPARTAGPAGPTARDLDQALANQATVLRTRWDARFDDLETRPAGAAAARRRPGDPAVRAHGLRRHIDRSHVRAVAEADALDQLRRPCPIDAGPVPLLSRWALAPSAMLDAVEVVLATRPELVVECGSGTSTVYLARALQLNGHGRLVSLEHLADHAAQVEDRLKVLGLSDVAEIRHAPLQATDVHGDQRHWYAPDTWHDLIGIDLLLVDGPPGGDADNPRGVALPTLLDRLRPGATVLLDDVERSEERAILAAWLRDHPVQRRAALSSCHAVLTVGEQQP